MSPHGVFWCPQQLTTGGAIGSRNCGTSKPRGIIIKLLASLADEIVFLSGDKAVDQRGTYRGPALAPFMPLQSSS